MKKLQLLSSIDLKPHNEQWLRIVSQDELDSGADMGAYAMRFRVTS